MWQADWHSPKPWQNSFSGNLAIFCIDERFADACLDFLRSSLNMSTFDLWSEPGGAAFLLDPLHDAQKRLRLVSDAHKLQRIVLIAHDDCLWYRTEHPHCDDQALRKKQQDDLSLGVEQIGRDFPHIDVSAYYVSAEHWDIKFTPVAEHKPNSSSTIMPSVPQISSTVEPEHSVAFSPAEGVEGWSKTAISIPPPPKPVMPTTTIEPEPVVQVPQGPPPNLPPPFPALPKKPTGFWTQPVPVRRAGETGRKPQQNVGPKRKTR